jgi:hypothetical protein
MNRVTERIHLSVLGCEIELNGERERICLDVLADETGICPAGKKGITINVPFFKKLREIIFFLWDNNFMSHFEGHFEGAKTFLTP